MGLVKRFGRKGLIAGAGIIVLIVILVVMLRKKPGQAAEGSTVADALVSTGTIQTTVEGTGTLSYAESTNIVLPESVEVGEVLVSEGDRVEAGQMLATVQEASLYAAMSEVEDAISDVNDTINDEKSSSTTSKLTAGVSGRIKKIYASEDAKVSDVMADEGALMLISTDGLSKLSVKADLEVGDTVTVTDKKGNYSDEEATVESVAAGSAVITFDDSLFDFGETLVVKQNDKTIGTGEAEIHQPVKVMAYEGTVDSIAVSENQKVSSSTTLCRLTGISQNAEYMQAVRQREELETLLATLYAIKRNGGITAPAAGTVQNIYTGETSSESGASYMTSRTEKVNAAVDQTETQDSKKAVLASVKASGFTTMSTTNVSGFTKMTAQTQQPSGDLKKEEYTVTVADCENGTVSINGTSIEKTFSIKAGSSVAVEALPAEGYKLGTLEVRDVNSTALILAQVGTGYAFVMPESEVVVMASFEKLSADASEKTTGKENPTEPQKDENNTANTPNKDNTGSGNTAGGNNVSSGAQTGGNTAKSGSNASIPSSSASGQKVNAATVSGSSTAESSGIATVTAFTLASRDIMKVSVNVDELDILSMQVGNEAEIRLDAIDGEVFTGTITAVGRQSSSGNGVAQYPIEITFNQTDSMLEGMNASVSIVLEKSENTLVVPAAAVINRGNRSFVYTSVEEGTYTLTGEVEVTTGLSDDNQVEILSGLSEGDTVYYQIAGSINKSETGGFGAGMGAGPSNGDFPPGGGFPGSGSFEKGERPNDGGKGRMFQ